MHKLVLLGLCLALGACVVGPDYEQPDLPLPDQFTNGTAGPYDSAKNGSLATFWTQFDDPLLDRLVSDALAANHDLRMAVARVVEARALRGETRLDLAPTITAGGGHTEQLSAVDQTIGDTRSREIYDVGFDAFWELDFFGRTRRALQASNAELDSTVANLHDVQVIVVGEVTRTYFELRGQQQQLDVARRNVANQSETVRVTADRLEAGRGTELDTTRAQALLSATLATIAPLEAQVLHSIHRLGVLIGQQPVALREVLDPVRDLPHLPDLVAISDPTDMLRRRPDIRVAERQLAAAIARIGIAVADLFPRVTFIGSVGYAATETDALGEDGTGTRFVAPGITWAAFDLGTVRARIAGSRAQSAAALALYEKTVLRALEETENALVAHARTREQFAHLATSAAASDRAAELARLRYENGVIDFLQVLDAERTLLEAEDRLARSHTETATTLVAVYKALGGGWDGTRGAR